MNYLSTADRARIISALVEGNSINATSRMLGFSTNTITKLLVQMGDACRGYHDEHVMGVKAKRVQCDEIWSFVGAKMANATEEQVANGWGDAWTWTALDADSKLVISYLVGQRGAAWAKVFMEDVASRLTSRVQITTDGHRAYAEAVEGAFGMDVDYAMLIKLYGNDSFADRRYSTGDCIGTQTAILAGSPDSKYISTSYVERLNLTTRRLLRSTSCTTTFAGFTRRCASLLQWKLVCRTMYGL
jgi:IS1 family transposase